MDAELNIQNTRGSSEKSRVLLKSFVFSRKSCSFLPSRSVPPRGAIVILIAASGEMTWLQTLAIGQEEGFIELGECQIPVKSEVSDSLNGGQSHVLNNVLANLKHKLQHDRSPKRPECVLRNPSHCRNFLNSRSCSSRCLMELLPARLNKRHIYLRISRRRTNPPDILFLHFVP